MRYYEVLQVAEDASSDEIRAAYLRLVQQHHPDRHVGEPTEGERERFKQIQEAYEVLYDAEQRRVYDSQRSIPRPRDRSTVVTPAQRGSRATHQPINPSVRRDVPDDWLRRGGGGGRSKKRPFRTLIFVAILIGLATTVVPRCNEYIDQQVGATPTRPDNRQNSVVVSSKPPSEFPELAPVARPSVSVEESSIQEHEEETVLPAPVEPQVLAEDGQTNEVEETSAESTPEADLIGQPVWPELRLVADSEPLFETHNEFFNQDNGGAYLDEIREKTAFLAGYEQHTEQEDAPGFHVASDLSAVNSDDLQPAIFEQEIKGVELASSSLGAVDLDEVFKQTASLAEVEVDPSSSLDVSSPPLERRKSARWRRNRNRSKDRGIPSNLLASETPAMGSYNTWQNPGRMLPPRSSLPPLPGAAAQQIPILSTALPESKSNYSASDYGIPQIAAPQAAVGGVSPYGAQLSSEAPWQAPAVQNGAGLFQGTGGAASGYGSTPNLAPSASVSNPNVRARFDLPDMHLPVGVK